MNVIRNMRTLALLVCLAVTTSQAHAGESSDWDTKHAAALKAYSGGNLTEAEAQLQAAMKTLENAPPLDLRRATTMEELARLYSEQHKNAQAESLLEQALAMREKALWLDNPKVMKNRQQLIALYKTSGKSDKAAKLLEQQARLKAKTLGANSPEVLSDLHTLAMIYEKTQQPTQADAIYEQLKSIKKGTVDNQDKETIGQIQKLAEDAIAHKETARAESYYKRMIAIQEKRFGPDRAEAATEMEKLAVFYRTQKRVNEAEQTAKAALAIKIKALHPLNPSIAASLQVLGDIYSYWGDISGDKQKYAQAEAVFKRELAIQEKVFGKNDKRISGVLEGLGNVTRVQGKFLESAGYYERQFAFGEKMFGPGDPGLIYILSNLLVDYQNAGKDAEALRTADRALKIAQKCRNSREERLAGFITYLGDILYEHGKKQKNMKEIAQSERVFKEALAIRKRIPATSVAQYIDLYDKLCGSLSSQQKHAQAEPAGKQALALAEKTGNPRDKIAPLSGLAWVYVQSNREEKAEAAMEQVIAIVEKAPGSTPSELAGALTGTAFFYTVDADRHHDLKKYATAEAHYVRAIAALEKSGTPEPAFLKQLQTDLATVQEKMKKQRSLETSAKRNLPSSKAQGKM